MVSTAADFAVVFFIVLTLWFQEVISPRPGPSLTGPDVGSDSAACLRDRIKSLESDLKQLTGRADVWKRKAELAIESENFFVNKLKKLNDQL